ncbi:phosphoglycolate phosphatase [Pseudorhizobium tarimense]|uniref:phosphoglycolate phosphatase n=1 Tax=Pseudorhizobium tarimense TaxID=1079109 RepID=A0ABV2H186_9HYPH|nr:HAD family hydrolase [Pseudorhizobium tarimense]MCJ8517612.1 HAD family hydrolase [Pseudorhizobium tarimense]
MSRNALRGIGGILFDKDGTLIRYDESWAPVNREAARLAAAGNANLETKLLVAAGMDPISGHTHADSLYAAGNAAEIAAGFIAAGSPLTVEDLTSRLDALFVQATEYAVPVTDLRSLFSRLKARGLKLGIASSDNELSIRQTARRFKIDRYVDFVAGYDSGFGIKPEPGMVLGFCAAVGLEPGSIAMVGDNKHDLAMGANAGVSASIGVLTGTGTRDTLAPLADLCLDSIASLEELLLCDEKIG